MGKSGVRHVGEMGGWAKSKYLPERFELAEILLVERVERRRRLLERGLSSGEVALDLLLELGHVALLLGGRRGDRGRARRLLVRLRLLLLEPRDERIRRRLGVGVRVRVRVRIGVRVRVTG